MEYVNAGSLAMGRRESIMGHGVGFALAAASLGAVVGVLLSTMMSASQQGSVEREFEGAADALATQFFQDVNGLLADARGLAKAIKATRGKYSQGEMYTVESLATTARVLRDAGQAMQGANPAAESLGYSLLVDDAHRVELEVSASALYNATLVVTPDIGVGVPRRRAERAAIHAAITFGFRPERMVPLVGLTDYLLIPERREVLLRALEPGSDGEAFAVTALILEGEERPISIFMVIAVPRCEQPSVYLDCAGFDADTLTVGGDGVLRYAPDPRLIDGWLTTTFEPRMLATSQPGRLVAGAEVHLELSLNGQLSWSSPGFGDAERTPERIVARALNRNVQVSLRMRPSAEFIARRRTSAPLLAALFATVAGIALAAVLLVRSRLGRRIAELRVREAADDARRSAALIILRGLCACRD